MDNTQKSLKVSINEVGDVSTERRLRRSVGDRYVDIVGDLPLTTYKKVVDIMKTYGLTADDLAVVREKLRRQNNFLEFSYIVNDQTGQKFTLKDCTVSSNHNPQRYYGEIQNRINTLLNPQLNI